MNNPKLVEKYETILKQIIDERDSHYREVLYLKKYIEEIEAKPPSI